MPLKEEKNPLDESLSDLTFKGIKIITLLYKNKNTIIHSDNRHWVILLRVKWVIWLCI
jgi:hypothetical protein